MRQSPEGVCARDLGRSLLLCVALSVGLLSASSGAAPQYSNPPEVQALEGQSHNVNPLLQLRVAPSLGTASGDESRDVPKTFVDMTPAELARAVPELNHLKPAESQNALPKILERAGSAVAAFFDNFPNTACTEHVTSNVHRVKLTGVLHYDNTYNYLALTEEGSMKGRLREYRTDAKGEPVQPDGIVTFGFVALSVNFHPDYQADSRYRYLGREEMEKQDTYVVAFAQRPQVARQTASVQYLGQGGIVYLQGVAWIDPVSFRIVRLRTDIEQPESNVGLLKETIQVLYSEVSFGKSQETLWLPQEVTVTGQLKEYLFHNQHRYSDYRLFNVQVEQKLDKP
jgi:hypothetical protein